MRIRIKNVNCHFRLSGIHILTIICVLLASFFDASAERMTKAPSFQGYTGLLNTPNALTADEGTVFVAYTDHTENDRRRMNDVDNYFFSLQLIPCLEIGGRFTEEGGIDQAPDARRDLSAHFKLRTPRFFDNALIPDIAVGSQDPGGGSSFFRTHYFVVSREIPHARFSLGYGTGPDRMEGVFGGVEAGVFRWLHLIGEYDTEETNLGIRLTPPESILPHGFEFGAVGKMSTVDDFSTLDFSVYAAIPIGGRRKTSEEKQDPRKPSPASSVHETPSDTDQQEAENMGPPKNGARLIGRLDDLGFENIAVRRIEETLYIEYENNRYNHNELDGLGLVMGTSAEYSPDECSRVIIVIKEVDLPLMTVEVEKTALERFFNNKESSARFSESLTIQRAKGVFSSGTRPEGLSKHNRSFLKPRLSVYPGIMTFIGTDYGAFDYLLSIRPDLRLDLWPGGMIGAIWDIPVHWTGDFDDGEPFRSYRGDARMERIMLHQAVKLSSGITALVSAGKYLEETTGLLAEAFWSSGTGRHRFSLKAGAFEDENDLKTEVAVGSYRYYYSPLDLSIEVKYGQYWRQDKGFLFKLNRYFNDTAVYTFYRHVGQESGERAVGIGFSLPLTPKRDMKPRFVQIKGASRWAYEHQITVAESGEKNPINTDIAVVPNTGRGLDRIYYNGDRLSEAYIRNHTQRLRQAYCRWGVDAR